MNQPKELTLTLPVEAMEVVMSGLAELPFRMSAQVVGEAQRQFTAQRAAQQPAQEQSPAA
ncbi:hypothetical protein PQR05_29330 [Paraburkholderia sediminicola]|uniref:hypothetical protein n=1 Tax=Paraburkholderia sediminicola TaxID=458836 RepID=UPI0038BC7912